VATYPRLGLPLPLELVNTSFVTAGQPRDALATQADLRVWLHANGESSSSALPQATPIDLRGVRTLRSALRNVFVAVAAGGAPSSADVDLLNALNARAPQFARIDWLDSSPRLTMVDVADPSTAVLARIARASVELLSGPDREHISRCQAPGCVLFFLKEPRRRHWCSTACGNRARVARHYDRRRRAQNSADTVSLERD
jgi:predicted RNA-binding Zn ribbon-like protein